MLASTFLKPITFCCCLCSSGHRLLSPGPAIRDLCSQEPGPAPDASYLSTEDHSLLLEIRAQLDETPPPRLEIPPSLSSFSSFRLYPGGRGSPAKLSSPLSPPRLPLPHHTFSIALCLQKGSGFCYSKNPPQLSPPSRYFPLSKFLE